MKSEKKCVVVTGCSKGLGFYITQRLLALDYQVLGCARTKPDLEHDDFYFIPCNLADAGDRGRFLGHVKKGRYSIYGLVNNAAMGALNQFLTTPTEKVEEVMQANYLANFELSRELAKLMTKAGEGRIIHIGSQTVLLKTPLEAAYAASKAAVETMMKISAKELAAMGITVNMVSPGVMETDIIRGIPKERIDYMLAEQVTPKPLAFNDVWHAVYLLLSPDALRITGQNIYVGVA